MNKFEGLNNTIESSKFILNQWISALSSTVDAMTLKNGAHFLWYEHERFAIKEFFENISGVVVSKFLHAGSCYNESLLALCMRVLVITRCFLRCA